MQECLNDLTDGIQSFLSSLGSSYEGESADHIKSLCTSEINPLINNAKSKVNNLESILPYISKIEKLNKDIDGYKSSMSGLSYTKLEHIGLRRYYNDLIIQSGGCCELFFFGTCF